LTKTAVMTKHYDSADYLKTPEALAAYLEDVLEDNDPALIAHAIGVAARAHGMSAIAKKTNLSRESLYRTLSAAGNPELETLIKVLTELGLRLSVEPKKPETRRMMSVVSTGARVSSVASKVLGSKTASKAERSVAASALTQTKRPKETTSKAVASAASKILHNPKASKAAKSVAASALTQKVKKK